MRYHRPSFVLSEEELKVLNGLKNDQDIVIIKADKGSRVVILDKIDYNKKMEEILQDSSKFKCLNDDPIKLTLLRENKVRNFQRTLKKTEAISQTTYEKLFPTGSRTGILYGLPKIHKNDVHLRPILSSINTHSHKFAKFLVPILRPISSGIYMVSDSFFCSGVTQLKV